MIKKKEIKGKKKKNPFLKSDGGFDLIEKFPGVDFIPYESKKKRKTKR